MEETIISEFPELLEFTGFKKKKKVVKFSLDVPEPLTEKTNAHIVPSMAEDDDSSELSKIFDSENDLSFNMLKKKKKKKVNKDLGALDETVTVPTPDETDNSVLSTDDGLDYTYEDLLTRAFNIMREKDPNHDVETRKKLVMRPPQVLRIGSKKSSLVNFLDICKYLHRTPQHVQNFLLVELGTTGSVDGNNQLIIKGRFEQKQIENVLRHYIKEYVSCHTCRSPETMLQKDTRLFFLQCESCGSRCSVASIKSGFQALTGKRAAIRAKAT